MKVNASAMAVLGQILTLKKATKAQATSNGGNAVTLKKLVEANLVKVNPATKKLPETFSLTTEGKKFLKNNPPTASVTVP